MTEETPAALVAPLEIHSELGRMQGIDIGIVVLYIVFSIALGVILSKRSRESVASYFTSGGKMPWWLLGTSMVATTFAADTPLVLSGFVSSQGISQNWFWWCGVMMVMGGVFFFARLWRRARLATDTELVAIRYSGQPARALRTFRALYLSLFYSIIIMGWVNLAMVKVVSGLMSPMDLRMETLDNSVASLLEFTGFIAKDRIAVVSADSDAGRLVVVRESTPYRGERGRIHEDFSRFELTVESSGGAELARVDLASPESPRTIGELLQWVDSLDGLNAVSSRVATAADLPVELLAAQELRLDSGDRVDLRVYRESIAGRLSLVLTIKILFVLYIITIAYCAIGGFWGVVVTDLFQFTIAMAGCIYLAFAAVALFGGMGPLLERAELMFGAAEVNAMLSLVPPSVEQTATIAAASEPGLVSRDGNFNPMPFEAFLVFILVFWFSVGFTDGGNVYAQRMIGARSERDAMLAYLWYAVAHFCLRMWPWLLVGVVGVCLFPNLAAQQLIDPGATRYDPEMNYIYTMRAVLGPGLLGIMISSFLAAYMSTITTHVNIAASYLVSDIYQAELVKGKTEKHYVNMAIISTLLVSALGIVTTLFLSTIAGAWFLIASLNAGIGIVYILRWYWWRINAWSELSCLIALFVGTLIIQSIGWGDGWKNAREQDLPYTGNAPSWYIAALDADGMLTSVVNSVSLELEWTREVTIADGTVVEVPKSINFAQMPFNILLLVPFSLAIWLPVTFLTRPTDHAALVRFYRRVRPGGPGWRAIASECPDIPREETLLNRKNFLCWFLACLGIYAALFGMGDIFFFSTGRGIFLLIVAVAASSGVAVLLKHDGKPDTITDVPPDSTLVKSEKEG